MTDNKYFQLALHSFNGGNLVWLENTYDNGEIKF